MTREEKLSELHDIIDVLDYEEVNALYIAVSMLWAGCPKEDALKACNAHLLLVGRSPVTPLW